MRIKNLNYGYLRFLILDILMTFSCFIKISALFLRKKIYGMNGEVEDLLRMKNVNTSVDSKTSM